ncbi:MAG: permease-like cell division protein FtsX [Acidiferrobacteraceae bacterium]
MMRARLATMLQARMQALAMVLRGLAETPAGTILGAAVVAVALALPAGLYGLMVNAERLTGGWDRGNQMSVYLHRSVTNPKGIQFAAEVAAMPGVRAARYVSPAMGLRDLGQAGHFEDALHLLPHNPLPPVVVVKPRASTRTSRLGALIARLRALPEVASVEADLTWVRRLQAGLSVLRRIGLVLACGLALAVVVAIGNNARLQIVNHRSEIELMKLVGATDAFIRRPFVYAGAIQGFLGGVLGGLLLALAAWILSFPVTRLARLYGNHFALHGPGLTGMWILAAGGFVLGWLGARIAVGRHLGAIEPTRP